MEKQNGGNQHMTDILFTISLFCVFAVCALFVILIGGRVYQNIAQRMDSNYTARTTLCYISNKIRSLDASGNVTVEERDGLKMLVMEEEINGGLYHTLIYFDDGKVKELFADKNMEFTPESGLPILEAEGLDFQTEENGLLHIWVDGGTQTDEICLYLRSGGKRDE